MDIHAPLRLWGRAVWSRGTKLDQKFGLPEGNHQREWALGMKAVVELPENTTLQPVRSFTRLVILSPRFLVSFMFIRIAPCQLEFYSLLA